MAIQESTKIKMKDSGVEWIGEIPEGWRVSRVKDIFLISKEKINGNAEKYQIYALTLNGLKKRDVTGNEGQIAASYDNYSLLRRNDIVLNPMDLISGFVARQSKEGIISPAYSILRPRNLFNGTEYYERYFQFHYFYRIFFPFGKGVSYDYRWTLGNNTLMNFPILVPPRPKQEQIVEFLDEKTEKIDLVINKKKKLIELLKEKRASLITRTVTKGLDPNVKMKESGVEWIGEIPEGWDMLPLRAVLRERKEKNRGNKINNILSVMKDVGVIRYDDKGNIGNKSSDKPENYKIVRSGDIVANSMNLVIGSVGLSQEVGVTSSVYLIYYLREDSGNTKYFYYLFKTKEFQKHLGTFGRGMMELRESIKATDVKSQRAPLPSGNEQKQIAEFLDEKTEKIDKAINKTQAQIKKLQEYKSSLIYHAVTGKIKI
jgi:type I restriction enzyme, S subunit